MKKILPHLIALAAFIIITMAYFSPLMAGKELKQSDINNWEGMSKEISDFKKNTGESTLWTNSMFGGMPAYQISAVYAANLVQYLNSIIFLGLPSPANLVFLLMAGFYFLLIVLKVDNKVAVAGALAFAFSSYFFLFIVTGHNSKAHAIGYMAPVIAGIILTYRGKTLLGAAITGLALALELYANHLQITFYLMMLVLILIIFEFVRAIREKRFNTFLKGTVFLGIAAFLAILSNITNLWATEEYGKYSTRGPSELTNNKENQTSGLDRDYITDWSYGIGESFTLLIPGFKGGASEPIQKNHKDVLKEVDPSFREYVAGFGSYFGDQPFTGGPLYIGAIIILLFVIGLIVIEGPVKWWLLSGTILSLLLSWGHNFMSFTNLFLDYFPGYDKFRAVTTILVIAEFTIPLLGILALNKMVVEKDFFQRYKKKLTYALAIVIGFTFIVAVAPGVFTEFYTQQEYEQVSESVKSQQNPGDILDNFFKAVSTARESIVKQDAMRSLMLLIVAGILIYTFVRYRYKKEYFIAAFILFILIDLVPVDKRYLNDDDFVKKITNKVVFPESQADVLIKEDTAKSYRVLNIAANTFNDASTSYYHQSIGGYHGAKLKRYKELIDFSLTPELAALRSAMQKPDSNSEKTLTSQPALNMLNTKYIIYNPDAPPFVNSGALGNAWFVHDTKIVANADMEIAGLRQFDPKQTAVVDERFKQLTDGSFASSDPAATILLTSYKPNHLIYSSTSTTPQLAVFSEIYYDKGWNATIDGKPSEYFRADYVLRGMKIPAGNHQIEFKFEPEVVAKGEKIAFASSALLILLSAFAFWKSSRRTE